MFKLNKIILKNDYKNMNVKRKYEYDNFYLPLLKNIDSKLSTKINTYYNLKHSNGLKFLNFKTINSTLFLNSAMSFNKLKDNLNNVYYPSIYELITIDSLNLNLSKKIKINKEERFNKLKGFFSYNDSYKFNSKGKIFICLPNLLGWFPINVDSAIKKLKKLILAIRKYNNTNAILITFHPKNKIFNKDLIKVIIKTILSYNFNKIEFYTYPSYDIDIYLDAYCVFIQNSKFIIDLVSLGIPVYNPNFTKINLYYQNIFGKKYKYLENLEKYQEKLPNREIFLKDIYSHIFFRSEMNTESISRILYNSINDIDEEVDIEYSNDWPYFNYEDNKKKCRIIKINNEFSINGLFYYNAIN